MLARCWRICPFALMSAGQEKPTMRIHMNRLRNIVGLIAVCATAAFFTGCGEDDSPSGDNNNPAPNAPASLNGRTYQLTDTAGNSTIVFDPAAMNYTLTPSDNSGTESGTFTATQNGDGYNVSLVNAA